MAYLKFWREGIMVVLVIGLLWYRGSAVSAKKDLVVCKQDRITLQSNVRTLTAVLEENERALEIVQNINAENARAAEMQRQAVAAAEKRIRTLRSQLSNMERFVSEMEEFADDNTCRTLSDPLPVDFIDGLRDISARDRDTSRADRSRTRPLRGDSGGVDYAGTGPRNTGRGRQYLDAGSDLQGDQDSTGHLQRSTVGNQPSGRPTMTYDNSFTFVHKDDSREITQHVTFDNGPPLSELLQEFEMFLAAVGFAKPGNAHYLYWVTDEDLGHA